MGAVFSTNLRNWLLAVLGSPMSSTFTSPRSRTPSASRLREPQKSRQAMAILMSGEPKMDGATMSRMRCSTSRLGRDANSWNARTSASLNVLSVRREPSAAISTPSTLT